MRLQSLKGINLYVIETQFLEPHILYVGLLDLVTIEIHSKDLLQNNDFHITSSIFLLSSVLVFYFFLILFFNSIVYRFFIARIFGVLPEYFRDWGGLPPPPPPRPPGSYAYGCRFLELTVFEGYKWVTLAVTVTIWPGHTDLMVDMFIVVGSLTLSKSIAGKCSTFTS